MYFHINTDKGRTFNVQVRKSYLFGKHTGWEFSFHDVSISINHVITIPYTRKKEEINLTTIRKVKDYLKAIAIKLANDLEARGLFSDIKPNKKA